MADTNPMKRLFSLLALFCWFIASFAHDVEVDGIYYNLNNGNMTATVAWDNYSGDITIPGFITVSDIKYTVTDIDGMCFCFCDDLTSVSFPSTITSNLTNNIFWGSIKLTSINVDSSNPTYCSVDGVVYNKDQTELIAFPKGKGGNFVIPASVASLAVGAFGEGSLGCLTIPNTVKSMRAAFDYCGIGMIILEGDKIPSGGIGGYNCYSTFAVSKEVFENYIVAEGWDLSEMKIVAYDVVKDNMCFKLIKKARRAELLLYGQDNEIIIPSSISADGIEYTVTEIANNANKSYSATNLVIPNTITSIGDGAFSCCRNLNEITIPASVENMGNNVFEYCDNVKTLKYADGCKTAFKTGLTSIETVFLPNSVTRIADEVFSGCAALASISIPDAVQSIGDYAFKECSTLTSVDIPDIVQNIGEGVFEGCI